MDNKKIFAQIIDFQKNIFDNSFAMISNIQDQSEQILNRTIEKNPIVPNDTLKVCSYWMDLMKKNRKNYKAFTDTNFIKLKDLFKINEQTDASSVRTDFKADSATIKKA